MFNFLLLYHVIFILNVFSTHAKISDKRLCGNQDCTEIIGYGKTLLAYSKPYADPRLLSFKQNQVVTIYSKEAGSLNDLWGVEINGHRGYAPRRHIREDRPLKSKLEFEVDTESLPDVPSSDKISETPEPTKASYEIVDGTTIYENSHVQPSSTENPVQASALPNSNTLNSQQTDPLPHQPNVNIQGNIVNQLFNPEASEPTNSEPNTKTDFEKNKEQDTADHTTDYPAAQQNDQTIEVSSTLPEPLNTTDQIQTQTNDQKEAEVKQTEATASPVISSLNNQASIPDDILSTLSNLINAESEDDDEEEVEDDDGSVEDEDEEEDIEDENVHSVDMPVNIQAESKNETEIYESLKNPEDQKEQIENVSAQTEEFKFQEDVKGDDNKEVDAPTTSSESLTDLNNQHTEEEVNTTDISEAKIVEVTTSSPEVEMPNPYYSFGDVTQNPNKMEEANFVEEKNSTEYENTDFDSGSIDNSKTGDINGHLKDDFTTISMQNKEDLSTIDKLLELPPLTIKEEELMTEYGMGNENKVSIDENKDNEPTNKIVVQDNSELSKENVEHVQSDTDSVPDQVNIIEDTVETHTHDFKTLLSQHHPDQLSCSADPLLPDCKLMEEDHNSSNPFSIELPVISYKILIVLVITAVTIVVFLWGYAYIDKRGREGILIGKINDLQKQFLITQKENELLTNKLQDAECEFNEKSNTISNEMLLNIQEELEREQESRSLLEAQVQTLEKELENSTEVGLELNKMLSQFLSSENGSEILVSNIEQLQRQIIEQQDLINGYNDNLSMKETENHELRLEVDINNTKVTELQSELNKMALSVLKLEEDKEQLQSNYETELENIKEELDSKNALLLQETSKLNEQIKDIQNKYEQVERNLEIKSNEYLILKENINQIKKIENNGDSIKSLLDISSVQAELLQLRKDEQLLIEQMQVENSKNSLLEGKYQSTLQDFKNFKEKYDEADREKVEAITKLEVLDKYFKEREAQLQRELSKQESMWVEKQGEATSTIERIKYMQEELQNYKAQNELLKQEILEQEVQMKSQISVLEKKAHENWVAARQSERKLEDAKQEAAQLRNRLTLRERTLNEEKMHNRIQSPIEHNGEIPVTPTHISNDTAASPPLLYGARENLTISPPLPGLPFLPPPPGVPFMPPPLGGVPLPPPGFMPPPPSLIPGDHRPPPLGRISSPPLNSRYSPDRPYSPYSRNSPSPTSDDEYERMPIPPLYRGYNSYSRDERRDDSRRELHRPPPMMSNTRNNKGAGHSSGSANSTESLDKINRHNSKV